MKILTQLILTGGIVLSIICGCSKVTADAPEPAGETETTEEISEEPAGESEITEEIPEEPAGEKQEATDKVASASDMAEVTEVVKPGMTPVLPADIENGDYEINVDSSSSMFRITHCDLSVKDDEMTARMQMGGTGYLYLFMGTGQEAASADESSYIPFEETDGIHYFTVPVEALDKGIAVAAFSKKKQMWYDRTLVFLADSLPAGVGPEKDMLKVSDLISEKSLTDGEYKVEVAFSGGTGKTTIESPAKLVIEGESATATIVFSSPHYDYVKIGEEIYKPVNKEGNSTFELPVDGFDYEMPIIADTTAMSTPHEISYTLKFDSASIKD